MDEEKILNAIALLGKQMDERFTRIDEHFARVDARLDRLEADVKTLKSDVEGLKSDMKGVKATQHEDHLILIGLREATEKNAAEIDNLRLTTASAASLQELKDILSDGFTSIGEGIRQCDGKCG